MWYNKVVVIKFLAVKRDIFWRDFPGIQTGITVIGKAGNDSNLLIVFYVQIMPDDLVMQLHRF